MRCTLLLEIHYRCKKNSFFFWIEDEGYSTLQILLVMQLPKLCHMLLIHIGTIRGEFTWHSIDDQVEHPIFSLGLSDLPSPTSRNSFFSNDSDIQKNRDYLNFPKRELFDK